MMRRMVAALKPEPPAKSRIGPYTWDDFVVLPDDDKRELIDGHFIEVDVPTYDHEAIVAVLIFHIYGWAKVHGGRTLASGYKIKVSPKRGLMPDAQYYRAGRRPQLQGLTEGAPDLGVEIISPSSGRYDRVTKLESYRAIGMPEYWLIDPVEQTLHRFVLIDDAYRVEALDGDRVFSPDTFPGLELPLAELWATMLSADASTSAADPASTSATPEES